jgi:hypothetical protein
VISGLLEQVFSLQSDCGWKSDASALDREALAIDRIHEEAVYLELLFLDIIDCSNAQVRRSGEMVMRDYGNLIFCVVFGPQNLWFV